jgi:hypothetical protein
MNTEKSTEESINSKKYNFAQITFKKNPKTPSEYDHSCFLTDNDACELLNEIHSRLLYLEGKYNNIKLKDISQEDKNYLIDKANSYLSLAIENLNNGLKLHIETKPQEHYYDNAIRRFEQTFQIRQMLIIYLFSSSIAHYKYLHITI